MINDQRLSAEKINGQWKIKKTDLKKLLVRGPGIKEYSVRLFFRKFTRGQKGSPPFIEARHGKSGHGKVILKAELKNTRKATIENTKSEIKRSLQKDGYKKVFYDF